MVYLITNQQFNLDSDKITLCTVQQCIDYLSAHPLIAVDTETTSMDPYTGILQTMQLGTPENQYVIDCSSVKLEEFKPLLEDKDKTFIFHNAKFDLRFLLHYNIHIRKVYDTFLAECILTTGHDKDSRELSLKALCKNYLDIDLSKEERGKMRFKGLVESTILYAAYDVRFLHDIRDKQLLLIRNFKLDKILELENEVTIAYAKMEYHGVLIDIPRWNEVIKTIQDKVSSIEKELDDIVIEQAKVNPKLNKFIKPAQQLDLFSSNVAERKVTINWSSSKQKLALLKMLGISVASTDSSELRLLQNKHPIIPKLLQYSEWGKLNSSFGKSFLEYINPVTQRVHTSIWQILAAGRISTENPNINNIPRKGELGKVIRSCFIAAPGYKIVGGDFSNIELRLIAQFSKDPLWLEVFNKEEDLHSKLCAMTFNIPITDVRKPLPFNPSITYRDAQKTIDFALVYGASKHKIATILNIPVDDADRFINTFFSLVPRVKQFLDYIGELGKLRGFIRTSQPYGRIRWFSDWKEEYARYKTSKSLTRQDHINLSSIERESKNTPVQGSSADILKRAIILADRYIEEHNIPAHLIMSVYDELQYEVREDYAQLWADRLQEIMISAAKEVITSIPVKVDIKISNYWEK